MNYKCRTTKPHESSWHELGAAHPTEAAMTFFAEYEWMLQVSRIHIPDGEGWIEVNFALVEVEGHGEFIARMYHSKIYRKGGVKVGSPKTIKDVALDMGWRGNPEELLEPGWDEESNDWE